METEIRIRPEDLENHSLHKREIARRLKLPQHKIKSFDLIRRSIDARGRQPKIVLRFRVNASSTEADHKIRPFEARNVSASKPVIIAGFGPAGMFAALKLIESGFKPIVIERGKAVRERRRDLAKLNKEGVVNPESNYCFGEGGAGTFSDGKLYTRSHKRGNILRILELLVLHGASEDILIDAHPHIGTNKLPGIVEAIRNTIIDCGGEVLFDHKITGFLLENDSIKGVQVNGNEQIHADQVILATGHSARDIFELLHRSGILIEFKPFALGVRVEHPQHLIDKIQYACETRHANLPAASYSLVHQVMERGVYSFCMCPGGIICPAATEEGEVVVNGWSPSKRNSKFANSGIVVELQPEDLKPFQQYGVFAGVEFQRKVEQAAFKAGGGAQVAPASRLTDFVNGKVSSSLPDCSYLPGIHATDLSEVLPKSIHQRLRNGFEAFGKKMKGYLTNEALVVATESRTSSPVRIPRDKETLMHPGVKGLFPCGEGAGYAGGIVSAAMDGERCALAAIRSIS